MGKMANMKIPLFLYKCEEYKIIKTKVDSPESDNYSLIYYTVILSGTNLILIPNFDMNIRILFLKP